VSTAENHEDAIDLLLHKSFDLIVVDMELPKNGCSEVFRFVRKRVEPRFLPFIFIATKEYAQWHLATYGGRALDGGPDLIKPFSIQDLEEAIISRIKRSKEMKRAMRRLRKHSNSSTKDE
jgi:DNA-binding response OmpR family regulator